MHFIFSLSALMSVGNINSSTIQGFIPNPEKKRGKLRWGIIQCPRKETGSMDGLSAAKQNGGQAPSDLTRRLVFLIVHFISVLTLTGCSYPERRM